MSISQLISKSTVRIECDVVGGGVSVGTGFWFGFSSTEDPDSGIPLLVTNKHVIANSTTIRIRFNVSSATNQHLKFYDVTINNPIEFIQHPDPNIDICALPIFNFLNELSKQGLIIDNFSSRIECFLTSITLPQLKKFL